MKRYIRQMMAALAAVLSLGATAQNVADTVFGSQEKYFTYNWYDKCPSYLMDESFRFMAVRTDHTYYYCKTFKGRLMEGCTPTRVELREEYAPQRVAIKGITAMVVRNFEDIGETSYHFHYLNPYRGPEYVMLFGADTLNGEAVFVDSARWDTAAPHLIVLPKCAEALETGNMDSLLYCHGYNAYFNHPHVVEGPFFTGGTCLNNERTTNGLNEIFIYIPTAYFLAVEENPVPCMDCEVDSNYYTLSYPFEENLTLYPRTFYNPTFGPFLAIIDTDSYRLTVTTSDSTAGMAYGSGIFRSMTQTAIYAETNEGYHFAGWSDGNNENPRMMEVYCDTTVEALFATGEGIEDHERKEMSLTPNPATDEIVISTEQGGDYTLTLRDAGGRVAAVYHFNGNSIKVDIGVLSAGVYVAQLSSNGKTTSKIFVKQ